MIRSTLIPVSLMMIFPMSAPTVVVSLFWGRIQGVLRKGLEGRGFLDNIAWIVGGCCVGGDLFLDVLHRSS